MSQRTRGHTTGATAKPTSAIPTPESPEAPAPRRSKRTTATKAEPAPDVATPEQSLSPDALARALRAMATELERDPALAQRVAQAISGDAASTEAKPTEPEPPTVGRTFHPTIVTGIAEDLGPGVPDPFALRAKVGEVGLKEALASLRLGSLRAIIRQHGLDHDGRLITVNDAAKLRTHILAATRKGRK